MGRRGAGRWIVLGVGGRPKGAGRPDPGKKRLNSGKKRRAGRVVLLVVENCTHRTPDRGVARGCWAATGGDHLRCVFIPTRRRRDVQEGEASAAATLPGAEDSEGGDRPAGWGEPEDGLPLDRDGAAGPGVRRRAGAVRAAPAGSVELDPYKAIIDERLSTYPKLSATRLYQEVRESGCAGSYSQVKRYVRRVRPRAEPEPERRFETLPERQGQVDFAEFVLPWGKRHALVVVLGYSRMLWLQYYERQTMETVGSGSGGGVRVLRGRALGAALRPDAGGRGGRPPSGGRAAAGEPGVPALRRPLGLPHPGVQAGPRADEGEGGATDPLRAQQLLLRSGVRLRRRISTLGPASGSTRWPTSGSTAR